MKICTLVRCVIVLLIAVGFSHSSNAKDQQHALARKTVVDAIRAGLVGSGEEELRLSDEDVTFAAVPTKTEFPAITVTAISADRSHRILNVRLKCAHQECLPFYASVPLHSDPLRLTSVVRSTKGSLVPKRPLVIKAGNKASYVLRSGAVRFRIPVVCLQPGSLGDVIRVRGEHSAHVLRARIESGSVLTQVESKQ